MNKITNFRKMGLFLFTIMCMFQIFTSNNNIVFAKVTDNLRRGIQIDKNWTIKFNKSILGTSENLKKIKIYDIHYNEVKVSYSVNGGGKSITIKPKSSLEPGQEYYIYIDRGIKAKDGSEISTETQMRYITQRTLPNDVTDKSSNRFTVTIDAGQVFDDYVQGFGIKGKDINLAVAKKLGNILEKAGAKVIYTRNSDSVNWTQEKDVDKRAEINEKEESDLFLGIYCNMYTEERVNGIETYYPKGKNQSKKIAELIQSNLIKATKSSDRGVKEKSNSELLDKLNSPAIIADLGFISNENEAELLSSEEYQNKLAKALAEAVIKYADRGNIDKRKSVKIVETEKEVKLGSKFDLPDELTVKTSSGSTKKIDLIWKRVDFDTNVEGMYYSYASIKNSSSTLIKYIVKVSKDAKDDGESDKNPDSDKDTDKDKDTDSKEEDKDKDTDKDTDKDKEDGNNENSKYTVTLNPSRVGTVAGIVSRNGLDEKEVNLDVVLKAGKILEEKGINVVYTIKENKLKWTSELVNYNGVQVPEEIYERVRISNEANSDLMVSIGGNEVSSTDPKGVETFYAKGNAEGAKLGKIIQDNIIQKTGTTYRGVKENTTYNTLKLSKAPSVWAAIGFFSNYEEEELLAKEEYRQRIAEGIADAILEYLKGVEAVDKGELEVKELTYRVIQNEKFELPSSIKVDIDNEGMKNLKVKWGNTNINTSQLGVYKYEGTLEGTNKKVILTLIVKKAGSYEGKVLIDPGHGGYDSGGVGPHKSREKDIVLSVSLMVGDYLVKNGIDVSYTRASDKVSWSLNEKEDLEARTRMANNMKPDVYVSIHTNKFYKSSAHGIETFYYQGSATSEDLARRIQSKLVSYTGRFNRGIKRGNHLYVIRNTDAPAVLTELAFLSNYEEEKLLLDKDYQRKCAMAIAEAIIEHLDKR